MEKEESRLSLEKILDTLDTYFVPSSFYRGTKQEMSLQNGVRGKGGLPSDIYAPAVVCESARLSVYLWFIYHLYSIW